MYHYEIENFGKDKEESRGDLDFGVAVCNAGYYCYYFDDSLIVADAEYMLAWTPWKTHKELEDLKKSWEDDLKEFIKNNEL